jgi:hypothetical protein
MNTQPRHPAPLTSTEGLRYLGGEGRWGEGGERGGEKAEGEVAEGEESERRVRMEFAQCEWGKAVSPAGFGFRVRRPEVRLQEEKGQATGVLIRCLRRSASPAPLA